ncbi:MAG: hypothetical protein AAF215_22335 [Cyanobacteria bacterium P01_A01_bin.123]
MSSVNLPDWPDWIAVDCQYSALTLKLPKGWQRDGTRSQANGSTDIFFGPTAQLADNASGSASEPQLLVKTIPTPEGVTNFQTIAVALKQQQLEAGGGEAVQSLAEETITIDNHPARLDVFTYQDAALQTTVMQCQACIQQAESVCVLMGMARGPEQMDYLQLFQHAVAAVQVKDD